MTERKLCYSLKFPDHAHKIYTSNVLHISILQSFMFAV